MNNHRCADAGRDNCPCQLGAYGKCPVCPRIGKQMADMSCCEDCGWSGTCIYTVYEQSLRQTSPIRRERVCRIVNVKNYLPDFRVFLLAADRGFCQKASAAGAYVFLRRQERGGWFDFPVSVLKAEPEKGLLHLGICGIGVKSRDVLQAEEGEALVVRGIFENALTVPDGSRQEKRKTEQAVVFAKGIAVAPLRNLLDGPPTGVHKKLYPDKILLYLDTERIGWDFFLEYFGDLPAKSVHIEDFREHFQTAGTGAAEISGKAEGLGFADFDRLEGNGLAEPDFYALTSLYYADFLQNLVGRQIVRPVSGSLCCGEGICGACGFDDEEGRTVHRCKERRYCGN